MRHGFKRKRGEKGKGVPWQLDLRCGATGCSIRMLIAGSLQVLDLIDVPVSPARIIYAHTIKEAAFIRYASKRGVDLMTFDCEEELFKIRTEHPTARLVVRIRPPQQLPPSGGTTNVADAGCEVSLRSKFGCRPTEAVRLLAVADKLGLRVVGVSFYAGCRCYDPAIYDRCIAAAKFVFDSAAAEGRRRLELLDIGGGFYGDRIGPRLPFADAATAIRSSLERHFGAELSTGAVRVIAEPGQYMVASAFTLVVGVIGVRSLSEDDNIRDAGCIASSSSSPSSRKYPRYYYYLSDGAYGSLRYFDYHNKYRTVSYVPHAIRWSSATTYSATMDEGHSSASINGNLEGSTTDRQLFDSTLWGPTCDSVDVIIDRCPMERLDVGDWLVFDDMGFYSISVSSAFNGMPRPHMLYVASEKNIDELMLQSL
jgi:ornithine decarboxylase